MIPAPTISTPMNQDDKLMPKGSGSMWWGRVQAEARGERNKWGNEQKHHGTQSQTTEGV